jgi:xanthine/uracil permease
MTPEFTIKDWLAYFESQKRTIVDLNSATTYRLISVCSLITGSVLTMFQNGYMQVLGIIGLVIGIILLCFVFYAIWLNILLRELFDLLCVHILLGKVKSYDEILNLIKGDPKIYQLLKKYSFISISEPPRP